MSESVNGAVYCVYVTVVTHVTTNVTRGYTRGYTLLARTVVTIESPV